MQRRQFRCGIGGDDGVAADGIEEDETSRDRGGIQQTNNEEVEDDEEDEYLPSGCRCGWHLLCDSDRLSALNDRDRIG
jgi:hypothetical protein